VALLETAWATGTKQARDTRVGVGKRILTLSWEYGGYVINYHAHRVALGRSVQHGAAFVSLFSLVSFMAVLDVAAARSAFPALSSGFLYADNAGGSQCLATAVERIAHYLLNTNVQLGADYSISVSSTRRVNEGVEAARELFNAGSADEVVFGSSATMLVENLARAMETAFEAGDEIVITGEHEANAGPWKRLAARRGAAIKLWTPSALSSTNPYSISLQLPTLLPLLSSQTRLVALSACSNILGTVLPVAKVVRAIRERAPRAEICVDCVAYAPHRRMDVRAWDVDYAVFSMYKVYGPHASALYTRAASLARLASLAHHFIPPVSSYKLQPGGPGYEGVYGCSAVPPYLHSLVPSPKAGSDTLSEAFALIAKHEQTLLEPLLTYLRGEANRGVRIVGEEFPGDSRVPTVSFVVVGQRPMSSKEVVKAFDVKGNIGIRYGHFYAYTLVENLRPPLDIEDGVVRISLVHYNTLEEVHRIIEVLDETLT